MRWVGAVLVVMLLLIGFLDSWWSALEVIAIGVFCGLFVGLLMGRFER
jgi:TRAP-type C4-dicarboxylate transport system permease large subunit